MKVSIYVADASHINYAEEISALVYISAQERGTGIAKRSPEVITKKILEGKAVIAICEDYPNPEGKKFAGFSYVESWSNGEFVSNSGLIVAHEFRKMGLARKIKNRIFQHSRDLYPNAKVFSITTGLAVMKMNSSLGFKPVTFSEVSQDPKFWEGCKGCQNYDILLRTASEKCLCTALVFDPKDEHSLEIAAKTMESSDGPLYIKAPSK